MIVRSLGLNDAELVNGTASRQCRDGLLFSLVAPRWWYVALVRLGSIPFPLENVAVDIEVRGGTVGVGLLDGDDLTIRDERQLIAGSRAEVTLRVAPDWAPGSLLFRSVDGRGRPAVFCVRSMRAIG